MGTVLSNRTVAEMRSYFETHGSCGPWVRGNKEAANMWLKELSQSSKCVDDMQPLHLSLDMCHEIPDQRPTAAQVVSEILDFQGEVPYCGHCCDSENGTLRPVDTDPTEKSYILENHEGEHSFESLTVFGSVSQSSGGSEETVIDEEVALTPSLLETLPDQTQKTPSEISSNWQQPMVEDYEGTMTIYYPIADEEDGLMVPVDRSPDTGQNTPSLVPSNWQPPTVEDYEGTVALYYPDSPVDDDDTQIEPNSAEDLPPRWSRLKQILQW
jgi:hypothetical protein